MGENEYKVSLGVDIDISDLQSQINKAGDKVTPIPIKVEIENLNEIKKQLQNLGGTKGNSKVAIPIDTASVEGALKEVSSYIKEIKTSIGTLDSKSGMKSLLSSINQISTALDKASNKFDELNASMNALANKDFSINFGINMGKSAAQRASEQGDAKRGAISQLKQQAEAFEAYLDQYYKVAQKGEGIVKLTREAGLFSKLWEMSPNIGDTNQSLKQQIAIYKQYIDLIQKAAKVKGVDLSGVASGFSKTSDEIEKEVRTVESGVKETEEQFKKLKGIFGGIDIEGLGQVLEPIIQDLKAIKTALTDLSAETPLNQLKNSFDQLSNSITQLIQNCDKIKISLNDVSNAGANVGANVGNELANGFDNSMESVQASAAETSGVITDLKKTLETMKLDRSSIDAITKDIEELGFEVTNASVKMKDGNFDITVKGIDSLGRAVTEMRHLDSEAGEISGLGRTISQSFSTSDDVVRELNQEMTNFVKLQSQIGNLQTKIGKLELAGGNENQIVELKKQLADLDDTYARLMQTFSKKLVVNADIVSMDDIARFDDEIAAATQKAKNELNRLEAEYADTKAKLAQDIKTNIGTSITRDINKAHSDFNRLSDKSDKLRTKLQALDDVKIDLDTAAEKNDIEGLTSAYGRYKQILKDVQAQLDINKRAEQDAVNIAALQQAKSKLSLDMNNWLKENSAAARQFGSKIQELQVQINNCDKASLSRLRAEFNNIKKEAQLAGKNTQTLGDKIQTQFSRYSSYLSVASLFSYASQGLRDMFQQVVAIDTAMTELKKVTDESDASYNRFLSNAAKRSRELGTTIDGLVESTADFARLGYGFEDSQKLAEVANIYAVVGDEIEGVEDATQSLVSTMAAFKDEMNGLSDSDFALSIVDKMNEVANNYSISSGGIGEALQRSASSMAAANNTIDETIAMITAANEVAQNPDKVGNAMKTISMRIRAAKTELEEAGESTDGMAESTASLRAEIKALSGVDIMLNETTFKSTYQIMDELSQKWEDLSDISQATIIELMAGKHQGNIFSSLMSNFQTARDALETSLNSSGSAMKEHEKWQQSLEAQINKLKASWQGLSQAFLKSDFLKVGMELIIKFIDVLTELIDKIGTIPTILGAFGSFKIIKTILSAFSKGDGLGSLGGILDLLQKSFPNITKGVKKLVASLREVSLASGGAGSALGGFFSLIMQHPYITAAIIAVTALTTALTIHKKKAEDLSKEVGELTEKFKEEHNELKKLKSDYDTSNESSMISKYSKLSKGVDGLGKNVSLTAEEYSEYQSIVNKIAEQIPSLVSGYDSQGNAILSCKGNVEELTAAYEKLIHAQNQQVLSGSGDIEKNFKNKSKDAGDIGFWEQVWQSVPVVNWFTEAEDLPTDVVKKIESGLNNPDAFKTNFDEWDNKSIKKALESAGIDVKWYQNPAEVLKQTLKTDPSKIRGIVDDHYAQFADIVEQQKTIAQAKLSEAFDISSAISGVDYSNISEELQNLAYQTINSLDYDFLNNLQEQGKTLEQWTTEFLEQLNEIGKVNGNTIKDAFELQTQFNGGDINYGDYIKKLKTVEQIIDELNLKDEAKNQLKISLGLDENGVVDQYDALVKRLTSKEIGLSDATAKNFLNSLSAEELGVLVDIVPNLDAGATLKEIQSLIDERLAEEFKFDIEVETTGVEAFNTALSESRSAAGLTSESIDALTARYKDLEGFNAAALFEKTANGIHLNSEELSRLEEQYVSTQKLEIDKNLNTLVEKYNDLTDEIKGCTDAQKKEELQLKANAYKDKIDELSTLASQYDGLTSAFAKWQNALDGAEEGDNYDSLYENLEGIKELYDKGLVGTDKFKTAVQLMTSKDLSNADIEEIVSAYEKGYPKMQRYFTEGQKGCKNFLNDVSKLNSEWAHMNKDGSWDINFNAEEVADKLGVSVDFVLQIAKKLKDYGFEVNLDDSSVDGLKTKIEQTEAKLKELGQSPVDINVDIEASSANLGKIESEIEKAKNKIKEINGSSVDPKVKTAQLEDAKAKLESLIQKKQEASQPAFMKLDTSQVNASLVDALDKIKEYQTALNELNKLKELKEAGIAIDDSEIDSAQKKIDECAKAIQGLDGDVKVAIGLEEDGSIDSIKKSFEEGKVKIDANTDPALTKIEQLAENVDRIEDKDVTINVTVNGLDKVKELNKQIDLATDIKGDIDKLSDYVENAKELSKLGNNITSYVTAEVKGNVIDTKEYKLDNLKVFGESAKEVKGLGTFTSKVTANVEGNVIDTREGKLDNLKVYTDSAKDIKEFEGNIISNITANTLGSVFTDKERNIDNLKVFVDSAKGIKEIEGNITSNITANTLGSVFENKSGEKYIDNLKTFIDSSKGIRDIEGNIVSNITANTLGSVFENKNEDKYIDNLKIYIDSAKGIKDIEGNIISSITANTLGSVFENKNEDKYIDNLKTYVDSAKGIKNIEGNIVSNITANTLGSVFTDSERTTDNLKTFIESANGIKDIEGDIVSNITANTLGSVFNDKERSIDNLKVFIESAKGIKDIEGDIVSNITANTLGDVFTDKERSIDNLKVFTESAKGIKEIEGDIVSNITANTLGSVFTNPERETNNLKVFVESAKGIKDIEGDIVSNITANTLGSVFTDKERSIDNLKVFINSAKGIKEIEGNISSNITANVSGNVLNTKENKIDNLKVFADSAKDVKSVGSPTSNVTANVNGNVINTSEDKIDNLGVFATNAKQLKGIGNFSSSVSANATGNAVEGEGVSGRLSSLSEFKSIVSGMSNQTVSVSVTAKVDSENVNAVIDLLKKVSNSGVFKDYKATVQVGAKIATIDDTTVQNYKAPPKEGKVKYSVDPESSVFTWTAPDKDGVVNYSASVEALTDAQKYKTGTITYKAKISGFPVVNGTANINGSAFANGTSGKAFKQGDWGVKKSTTALTGELGQELVVYGNRFWTVGDHGAEFATIPKGAIVFNHKQTKELFANGKVTSDGGRGRMFANGTAFAQGTAFVSGGGTFTDEEGEGENTFDWLEVLLSRLERAVNDLDRTVNNSFVSWNTRFRAIDEEIEAVNTLQDQNRFALAFYADAMDAIGLDEDTINLIKNGGGIVNDAVDDETAEKIRQYQTLYDKYLQCQEAFQDLAITEHELYKQRFELVESHYDGILQGFEHTESMINEYISQAEAKGHIVSKEYYNALISNETQNINALEEERAAMIAERDEAVANGSIVEGSEAWYEMCAKIDSVTQAIEEGKTSLIKYGNAMRDIDWEVFDLMQERISDVTAEADFLIDLMSNDELFDDNGKMTDKGVATMGLHGQNYNTYMYAADEYGKEIADIDEKIANGELDGNSKDVINRRRELVELQRESILNAEQEKQSIKDLVSDGIEKELDALQERIDLRNEELESIKDIYDYQKNVQEQSEEIAALEKQRAAYLNDDSEENKARLQEITVSLKEAKENLKETEFDRYISQQEQLLSTLYDEYELVLNTRLDDIGTLMTDSVNKVNDNSTVIGNTISSAANDVGINLSETMSDIWSGEGNVKDVLTEYSTNFTNKSTTVINALNTIKSDVAKMAGDSDEEANDKVNTNKTSTSAEKDPTKNNSGSNKSTSSSSGGNKSSGGDGKVKIGDKVKFLSGKYYYDSQGVNPAGSKHHGDHVYITNVNNKEWATHPIHISTGKKLGKGDLGWLKRNQISGYATGKKNFLDNEIAWTQENGQEFIVRPSDGAILTPIAKGDSVLTSAASSNIWDMANSPAEFIKDNLNLGTTNVPNNSNVNNTYSQHIGNVVFRMDNVKNYEELLYALRDDKRFEKLVTAMTIDRIAGKSSLAKGKSIK